MSSVLLSSTPQGKMNLSSLISFVSYQPSPIHLIYHGQVGRKCKGNARGAYPRSQKGPPDGIVKDIDLK